ncbi:MAG: hypothetical protein U0354_01650 [Candidatus Sericytochromatia bacterium]
MENTIINKEDAILRHDGLKFAEETEPFAYRCDQVNFNGVLLVTNIRMSFYYIDDEKEVKFLHYLFNMTSKIKFYPNSKSNIFEIISSYETTTFIFRNKIDLIEFQNFINKNFPNIVEISEIERESPVKNKVFEKDIKQQAFQEIKPKKLLSFEGLNIIEHFKLNYGFYILNLIYLCIGLYFASHFFPTLKTKIIETYNYPSYWLGMERAKKDMFIIAKKMNDKEEYPENLDKFLSTHFKSNSATFIKDPWGGLYQVEYGENNFKLISYGADKKRGTVDDIVQMFAKINK